jgi:tRNA pseudouridine synthase 10
LDKLSTILDDVLLLLRSEALCDYCLGRQFARIHPEISNRDKGRILKIALLLNAVKKRDADTLFVLASNGGLDEAVKYVAEAGRSVEKRVCGLCHGLMDETVFRKAAEKAAELLHDTEFETFLVGARASGDVVNTEDRLRALAGLTEGENIRNEIKREISRVFANLTGKKLDYSSPDVVITVDLFRDKVEAFPNPVFISGRYLKHSRELPQSPWHCKKCWGRGCQECGYTGRLYPTSVAELVGEPAKTLYQAAGYKFHAAGREDVDALVEGEGRPFILELKRPRRRNIPLDHVQQHINTKTRGLVTVYLEAYTTRRHVRQIKLSASTAAKTYLLKAVYDADLNPDKVKELETRFRNMVVEQLTPLRVLRRRAEKLRRKTVYSVEAELVDSRTALFRINCQGGLYVKELVTGDGGRTKPSFAEVLGFVPVAMELTVLRVEA